MLKQQPFVSIIAISFAILTYWCGNLYAAECGNNTIETGEVCDGTDLGLTACKDLGFESGTLACAEDCTAFDTSGCTAFPVCGNNAVEAGELCDGSDLAGESCTGLGFDGGSLGCALDCGTFDTSGCTTEPVCGNNTIETGEICDGTDLGGLSCLELGFESGTLSCAVDCGAFDTSGCNSAQLGVKEQVVEIQEQLIQLEAGIDKLGDSVDEIAGVQSDICDRPVSWNRKFPDNERFIPALNGHAYCDLETGLTWMEEPYSYATWRNAFSFCYVTEVDGRRGWHLPSIEQLSTLIDRQNVAPALPLGHPFKGAPAGLFWSSSLKERFEVGQTRGVWMMDFTSGSLTSFSGIDDALQARVWCVRGGEGSPPITEVNFYGED